MQTPPPHPDSQSDAERLLGIVRDFGLDSLARVELLVRIERELGAKLGEKAFVDAETPAPAGASVFAEVKVYHPPQAASTLIEILDWHVTRHAEQVYLTLYDEEERTEDITYRMLQEQAKALAAGLHKHGLSSGDKVAIMLPYRTRILRRLLWRALRWLRAGAAVPASASFAN